MSQHRIDTPALAQPVAPPGAPGAVSLGTRGGLAGRLTALARLIQIGTARVGPWGFDLALLETAEDLLARSGERLRLSADHTVVVLAGGTGSGKSSLFNALAGADLSPVGVTRPMTITPHACVWRMEGTGPLLDWLGVPRRSRYARASALDSGEEALEGLVLLDLPDHDSVVAGSSAEVDRLVSLADLMIWVLDPQKYADAAVHSRYLGRLAGHSAVTAIVLNQIDLLTSQETEECLADLRRLLDSADFHDPRVIVTSAKTATGLGDLRKLLVDAVSVRHAASDRIAADVDALLPRFAAYLGPGPYVSAVDVDRAAHLVDAFEAAAGVSAVGDRLRSAYALRAADYVGWPVSRLAERLPGRDPVRKMRLGDLREQLRDLVAGPVGAQRAGIDNALSALASDICAPLPNPWSRTVRAAARSQADQVPAALGTALRVSLPEVNRIPGWWRLVRVWQWALIALALAGLAWLGALLAFGVFDISRQSMPLLNDATLIPWVCVIIAAILLLGWLTAVGCRNVVSVAAERQRDKTIGLIRGRIAMTAQEQVLLPIQQELSEYARYRDELRGAGLR